MQSIKHSRNDQENAIRHTSFYIIAKNIMQITKFVINKKNIDYLVFLLSFITVLLITLVLPSTLSRASWLGAMAVVGFLTWHTQAFNRIKSYLLSRLQKKVVFALVLFFIFAGLTGLYALKKHSALGRLLIWKITFQESMKKPLTGQGFNAFIAEYPKAQIDYFKEGKGNNCEKYIAGNVKWAFNEPMQLLFEQGIVGLGLFLLILWSVMMGNNSQYRINNAGLASITGIFVFSLFSYPLYSASISLVFFVSLGIVSASHKPLNFLKPIVIKPVIIAIAVSIAVYSFIITPKLYKSYWLWNEANLLYSFGYYKEANNSFYEAHNLYLDHNGIFLLNYAKSLYLSEQYEKALEMLKEGKKYYTDEVYFTTLGDTHKALGNYHKAEKAYWQAAHLVPHKFYPLYLLAKLYDQTGNKNRVLQTVNQIMNKKVKVHSPAIEQIKEKMKQLKKKYQ